MPKKFFWIVAIILISCKSEEEPSCNYITDYYQTMYKADYAFEVQDYQTAFDLYSKAFKTCAPKNTRSYYELNKFTECAAILEFYEITYDYTRKQVLKGVELNQIQNNPNYERFLSSELGKKFMSEYDELREVFVNNADFALRDEIINMRYADQRYRSRSSERNWPKQDSIDAIHEARMIAIFETIGYPTDEMVGPFRRDNNVDLGLILLHTDDSIRMNYFVPKLKEFIKDGYSSPQILGNIIDQYYLYNKEPQILGTYKTMDGVYSDMILDLKKVDSNRISIGLQPLRLKEKKDSLIRAKYGF